jgi:hypothetical protein
MAHRVTTVDEALATRSDRERARAIRALLADGPRTKDQMRIALAEPEALIVRSLHVLRDAGLVKAVIVPTNPLQGFHNRAWALVTWQRPVRVLRGELYT